jgi:hypothetical protein
VEVVEQVVLEMMLLQEMAEMDLLGVEEEVVKMMFVVEQTEVTVEMEQVLQEAQILE